MSLFLRMYLLNRDLARAREEVCDNYVLRHGNAPRYARTLLELSQSLAGVSSNPTALGLFHCRWRLEDRIADLLDHRRKIMTGVNRWTTTALSAGFLLLALLIACTRVIHAEPAAEEKAAAGQAAAGQAVHGDKNASPVSPKPYEGGIVTTGVFVTTASASGSEKVVSVSETGEEIVFIPPPDAAFWFQVYTPLGYEKIRKDDLGITVQQQEKLRKIHQNYVAELQKLGKAAEKETAQLPLPERQVKMFAAWKPLKSRTCKEIEEVLTATQLATLRNLVLCEYAFQLANPSFGLSAKQIEQLVRPRVQMVELVEKSYRENEEKSLAVLSPQQREQLERRYATTDLLQSAFFAHPSFMFVTPPGAGQVYYEALNAGLHHKELAVSEQQWTRLYAIFQSPTAQELYKFHDQVFAEMYGNRPEPKPPEAKPEANKGASQADQSPVKAKGSFVMTGSGTMAVSSFVASNSTVTAGESKANGSLLEQRLAKHPAIQQNGKSWKKSFAGRSRRCSRPSSWRRSRSLPCVRSSCKAWGIPERSLRLPPPSSKRKNCGESMRRRLGSDRAHEQAAGAAMLKTLTPQQHRSSSRRWSTRIGAIVPKPSLPQ